MDKKDSVLIEGEEWATTPIIIGVSVGAGILLAAGITAAAVIVVRRRKQRRAMDQPMTDMGLTRGQSSQSLLAPPSSSSYPSYPSYPLAAATPAAPRFPPPASNPSFVVHRPTPPAASPQFKIGQRCQAKYSGDGKYYRAVIDDIRLDDYLVRYVDFGNDSEWVSVSSLKL
jgi:hypothetical protein